MVKVLCIMLCLSDLCSGHRPEDHTQQHGGFVYTRNELLRLRLPPYPPSSRPLMPTVNTTHDASNKRKRGRRGGVKNRLRKRSAKPPLPSVVFANVQSLYNKIDELHAKCRYDNVYREACVVAFSETWLNSTRPDDDIILDGVYCVPFRQNQRIGQDERRGFVHLHKQSVVFQRLNNHSPNIRTYNLQHLSP